MKARGVERIPFIWFWPDGAPSCVMVTHDVETKAGVRFVERLMDIDDAFGIKASFQVVPQEQYAVSRNFMNMIHERGFEVNVQDLTHDGDLFRDREEFLLKAQSINRYVREYGAQGFRSGRMYRNVDWFDALDVSYDMSVPNLGIAVNNNSRLLPLSHPRRLFDRVVEEADCTDYRETRLGKLHRAP
jgi:hypothetical protein